MSFTCSVAFISIHALREEGDRCPVVDDPEQQEISIHALREEGDGCTTQTIKTLADFYPRPP